MPLSEEKNRRMALSIIKAVHECDAGMKQGIKYYRAETNPTTKTELLKRAARLPYRVEARVQDLVTKHGSAAINSALSQVSTYTLTDLQNELAPLKTYSDTLKDNFQNQSWTEEQVATDIEANRLDIDTDEAAPIPVGYTDDF